MFVGSCIKCHFIFLIDLDQFSDLRLDLSNLSEQYHSSIQSLKEHHDAEKRKHEEMLITIGAQRNEVLEMIESEKTQRIINIQRLIDEKDDQIKG